MREGVFLCVLLASGWVAAQTTTTAYVFTIHRLTLTSATNCLPLNHRREIIQQIQGHTYRQTADDIAQEIRQRVRYGYQRFGFFNVAVRQCSVTVFSDSPEHGTLDIALSVEEGEQYRLKQISFKGERAFSEEELRRQFEIVDGNIFDVEKIRKGLDEMRKLYANHGYINFTPVPDTTAADQTAAVSLAIDIDEGLQFRIGSLNSRRGGSKTRCRDAIDRELETA